MDPQTSETVITMLDLVLGLVLLAGGVVFCMLVARGLFSERAFEHAPGRQGPMTLADAMIGLGMYIVAVMIAAFVLKKSGLAPEPGQAMDARQLVIGMIITHAASIPVALFTLARLMQSRPDPPKLAPLRSMAIGALGVVVAAPVLLLVMYVVTVISTAAGYPPPEVGHVVLTQLLDPALSPWMRWGLILSAVIGAPLFEEILFRGLFQSSMVQSRIVRSRWTAIVITSVLFALIHLGATSDAPQALIMLYVLSLALGYVYERTGSLVAPITMHALFNGLQILAVSLMDPAQ